MKSKHPIAGAESKTHALRAELALSSPSCAYEEVNPQTCPLRDVRGKNLKARMAWLDTARDEAIANMYIFCRLCWEAKAKLEQPNYLKKDQPR